MARLGRAIAILGALLLLHGCGGGGGGGSGGGGNAGGTGTALDDHPLSDPVLYSTAAGASLPRGDELAAVTRHKLVLNGATLDYTATAGHLTARDRVTDAPEASFFYVAYIADNRDPATRPITFVYNGGPGSASVWLHLGSFGPKRLVTGEPSLAAPTPFPLVDNAETLLDVTDLVFVDAVGSGLSQAIAPNINQTFWGVDADAAVFRDFVVRYLALNARNASPKFLYGESYGTTRSAVLAALLESAGVALHGVVMQSSVLDYNVNCGVLIVAQSCASYLPSYGAVGAWFNLDNPNPTPAMLPDFLAQVRVLTVDHYDPAVQRYLATRVLPDPALLMQLVAVTGLPLASWQAVVDVSPEYFQTNLIPGMLLGRYDARMSVGSTSPLAAGGDPSSTFIAPSFGSAITAYLAGDLKYANPSSYVTLSNAIQTWNFAHDNHLLPDTIPDLAAALAHNAKLKVLAVSGYHDLATPFFQTERDLARLGAGANVQVRNYSAGHMTYLDDAARVQQRTDLVQFYNSVLASP